MLSSRLVKSPTEDGRPPTFVLAPAVLNLTFKSMGKAALLRVYKLSVVPLAIGTTGVSSQLLMSPPAAAFRKFAAM